MTEYEALCADLAAEHAALDKIVAGLPEADWHRATPAVGWTIQDQIVHLALTDQAAAFAAAEPERFAEYRARTPEARAEQLDTAGALAPPELLTLWREHRERLLAALRGVEARARIVWFGPPMSAMSHATARLMETWAHGQDVVDALAIDRPPTHRLKHIAHLGVRTRAYSYGMRGLPAPETDVLVELRGPDDEVWRWGDPGAPDQVRGSALDFCLVVVQRRHVDDTDLQCRGSRAREWLLIAQAFAGQAGEGRQPGQFRPARPG